MQSGFRGTFAISWAQTEIDGLEAAPVGALSVGSAWSWRGDFLPLDRVSGYLETDSAEGAFAMHKQASNSSERLIDMATDRAAVIDALTAGPIPENCIVVTDGAQIYNLSVIHIGRGAQPVLVFSDKVPPRNSEFWVLRHAIREHPEVVAGRDGRGMICFTEGTRIATPHGGVPVQDLRLGDLVLTKDNGPQPVEWIGQRHMSGARLFAVPRLRPIRIRTGALGEARPVQELLVSPQHRILMDGAAARDLFNTPEVLIAAQDLIDGTLVVTDKLIKSVTYFHLLLPDHNVVWANGVAAESFHPANTALESIDDDDRARLLGLMPALETDPHTYGGYARRNLTSGEAAILMQAA